MESMKNIFSSGDTSGAMPNISESGVGAGIDPFASAIGAGASGFAPSSPAPTTPNDVTGNTDGGFNIGKVLGTAGQLGGGITGLVNSFRDSPTEKLMAKQQKLAQQNIQAASSAGNQQLSQYMQGQLSAPQQASVDKFKKEQLAKWRQYLASAGIPESSAMADIEAKVDQDATDYAQKLLQQNFQNSVSALGLSNNALAQQAVTNLAYEKEIAKSQADAMSAIGQLGGLLGQLG